MPTPVVAEPESSILGALVILLGRLSPSRRRALLPLMLMMLAGALAEVVTIGAIVPLLAFLSTPTAPGAEPRFGFFYKLSQLWEPEQIMYMAIGLFALAAIGSAALRLLLLRFSQQFVHGISYELGVRLYADSLHQPYEYHIRHNTSEIISSINKIQLVTNNILVPLIQAVIAAVIGGFIILGLVAIDPVTALVAGAGFTAVYALASVPARRVLRRNGNIIARAQGRRVKAMQEGLGGIRDVLIGRSQPVFIDAYELAEAGFRDARIKNAYLAGAPRYLVEGAGMILIAVVAVALSGKPGGLAQALPVLGALALGAQRLLPLVQQVYNGWASTMGNKQVLMDVLSLLRQASTVKAPPHKAIRFDDHIVFERVCYIYPGSRSAAVEMVDLHVPKGARVGVIGTTGSGKSTLMDLTIGLLNPTRGEIRVDGVRLDAQNMAAWQENIAHVPQSIYLCDASVSENIAFGVKPNLIDFSRVRRAAEQAELAEVIEGLPQGYHTHVGERGIQLSGGQRQRIGIARALYKEASVLVFDEATSSLDGETEAAVMRAIEQLDRTLTILVIAHRLTTLRGCDMIIQMDRGKLTLLEPEIVLGSHQAAPFEAQ